MDYKSLMGYGKKKVIKEKSKSNKNKVLESIKRELNEWNQSPPTEKRWSKKVFDGTTGLTEFEKKGGKDNLKEVGAAAEYKLYTHAIEQNYKKYWNSVKDFEKHLNKKGLKKPAKEIHRKYIKLVTQFHQWFNIMLRKLL